MGTERFRLTTSPASGMRASDADRERTLELLRAHHLEGRLDASEFQERLERSLRATTLGELHAKAEFVRISNAGLRESHVHDVTITRESPNYPSRV